MKINIEDLEKEVRNIIDQTLHKILSEIDIYNHLEKFIRGYVENRLERIVDNRVYAYLEEAELELPDEYRYGKKITLNTYIMQVVREVITNRVRKELEKITITVGERTEGLIESK